MHFAFQDREDLYLICDLLSGGDLRYHIGRMRKFSEEQTSKRFCVTLLFRVYDLLHAFGTGVYAQ